MYIDKNLVMGNNVKIQNGASIFHSVTTGRNVFVGPQTSFTNDLHHRINKEWSIVEIIVEDFVSIGENCSHYLWNCNKK